MKLNLGLPIAGGALPSVQKDSWPKHIRQLALCAVARVNLFSSI